MFERLEYIMVQINRLASLRWLRCVYMGDNTSSYTAYLAGKRPNSNFQNVNTGMRMRKYLTSGHRAGTSSSPRSLERWHRKQQSPQLVSL